MFLCKNLQPYLKNIVRPNSVLKRYLSQSNSLNGKRSVCHLYKRSFKKISFKLIYSEKNVGRLDKQTIRKVLNATLHTC